MELAEGIQKLGFRRWYERQLIEGHLFLISGFMCMIMVAASVEELNFRTPTWETVLRFGAMLGGVVVCLWTIRRYFKMMGIAEYAAERSVCEKCATYRGLDLSSVRVSRAQMQEEVGEGDLPAVGVRCRKCGHEWTIE